MGWTSNTVPLNIYNIKGCYRFLGQAKILDDGNFGGSSTGPANGCTFAVSWSGSVGDIILARSHNDSGIPQGYGGTTQVANSILVFNTSSAVQVKTYDKISLGEESSETSRYMTIYNYGAGAVTVDADPTSSILIVNPNLVGGTVVTSESEDPATVAARDFNLTGDSTSCIGNCSTTSPAPLEKDILDRTRG
jgi:hypothetical protein